MKIKNLFKENGIFSGKRVLALVIAATFFSGTALGAAASNYTFGSTGDVVYDQGGTKKVVFDNDDLKYLDKKIDTAIAATDSAKTAAETGKKEIAKKLNTWSIPTKISEENPTYDGIKTSLDYIKSTPGVGEPYKNASGSQLYVKPDGLTTTNEAEKDPTPPTGVTNPLKIAAANAGNLSAGTAAWVNGEFIIGTGSDNNNYYEQSYSKAYQEGRDSVKINITYHEHSTKSNSLTKQANTIDSYNEAKRTLNDLNSSTKGGCYTVPVYPLHSHKGNETDGGGCYVPVYHVHVSSCSKTVSQKCGTWVRKNKDTSYDPPSYHYQCNGCGSWAYLADYGANDGETHYKSVTQNICGKTTSSVDSYQLGCGILEGQPDSTQSPVGYSTSCGHTNGEVIYLELSNI